MASCGMFVFGNGLQLLRGGVLGLLRFWGFGFEIAIRLLLLVVGLYYNVLYICKKIYYEDIKVG
jgi:uncharacterized membrane protein (Fun14 family)